MNLCSVATPRAVNRLCGLGGLGLLVLAAMPFSCAYAEPPAATAPVPAKSAAADKAAQEKAAQEKAAADKAAQEKAAQEKAAAEKAAQEKAAQEKAAAEKAAQEKAAQEKAAAEKAAQEKAVQEKTAAQTKLSAAASAKASAAAKAAALVPAECARTGQRVIAALARDDTGAASQFFSFYNAFKCPPAHLTQAFGCLVKFQAANPTISNPSPDAVSQCWNDPATLPPVPPAPPRPVPEP